MTSLPSLTELDPNRFFSRSILRQLAASTRQLAELKGVAASIPHQEILINTLGIQEAKDSSEIENIITTHDELYKDDIALTNAGNAAAKEVMRYRQALWIGFKSVQQTGLLLNQHILAMQSELELNAAGFRKLPGTVLKNSSGQVVYSPPQNAQEVIKLMRDLEAFINEPERFDVDPLIKMALIHHQFESIHPFYDGNGRTGRLINVLYLVKEGLLDIPVLYLSRYISRHKLDYYRLLQAVHENGYWEEWVLYMLQSVEHTSRETIATIRAIQNLFTDMKRHLRSTYRFYSQDLLNNLFTHPYTKIQFIEQELNVSRLTATKYLDTLANDGILQKHKAGRSSYYVNSQLYRILADMD